MSWVVWLIIGIIALGILIGTGMLQKFIEMVVICLVGYVVGGLIGWLIFSTRDKGSIIGDWNGLGMFSLYCIGNIVNPTVTVDYSSDFTFLRRSSNRVEGIAGLVMVAILALIALFN